MHVTSFLFLVRFNNLTLTIGLHALSLVAHSYALLTVVVTRSYSIRPFLCALDCCKGSATTNY